MKRIFTLLFYSLCSLPLIGQSVTISPLSTSAIIQSGSTTNGFLAPVLSKKQRYAIANLVNGLMIFQSPSIPDYAKGFTIMMVTPPNGTD